MYIVMQHEQEHEHENEHEHVYKHEQFGKNILYRIALNFVLAHYQNRHKCQYCG